MFRNTKLNLFFLTISMAFYTSISLGQTIYLLKGKANIKKEKLKFGVEFNKKWEIQPIYDKIKVCKTSHGDCSMTYLLATKGDTVNIFNYHDLTPNFMYFSILDTNKLCSLTELKFKTNILPYKKNGFFGWTRGVNKIEAIYDSLKFNHTHAVKVYKNGEIGLISSDGKEIVPVANYDSIGEYYIGSGAPVYRKDNQNGQLLQGFIASETQQIPIIYKTIEMTSFDYLYNKQQNSTIYFAQLFDNSFHAYMWSGSTDSFHLSRLPDDMYTNYLNNIDNEKKKKEKEIELKKREEAAKIVAEDVRRIWLDGLYVVAGNEGLGINDKYHNIILPATATNIKVGNMLFETDGEENIIIKEFTEYYQTIIRNTFAKRCLLNNNYIIGGEGTLMLEKIMVKINPYYNLSGNYKFNFEHEVTPNFHFKSPINLSEANCPVCNGSGKVSDGYDIDKRTVYTESYVPDGTTTVTKKNYLANERVNVNGTSYVPTYEQTTTNYKKVNNTKTEVTYNEKFKECGFCKGKKRYKRANVIWDENRQEYVLQSLNFN